MKSAALRQGKIVTPRQKKELQAYIDIDTTIAASPRTTVPVLPRSESGREDNSELMELYCRDSKLPPHVLFSQISLFVNCYL